MSQKLRDFLKKMSGYQAIRTYDPEAIEPNPMEPMSADDWQKFQRDFIAEVNGEPVHKTGMTHREFLDYINTGLRQNDQRINHEYELELYQGQGQWQLWDDDCYHWDSQIR
jgi:hypothetical protein